MADHLKHRYSMEYFLETLHLNKPYIISRWLRPLTRKSAIHQNTLSSIERSDLKVPIYETSAPTDRNESNIIKKIEQVVDMWKHNRELYPDWMVILYDKVFELSRITKSWYPMILRYLTSFEPIAQLKIVYELTWRIEVLLEPIAEELQTAIAEVLKKFDCVNCKVNGEIDRNVDWSIAGDQWINIALALVTTARGSFNRDEFDTHLNVLSPYLNDNDDIFHRIFPERCLWELSALNYSRLDKLLDDWSVENFNPVWMPPKSAILFESGRHREARKMVASVLMGIRRQSRDIGSVRNLSCEGWALYLALEPKVFSELRPLEVGTDYNPWSRWDELTPLKCNSYAEIQKYNKVLYEVNFGSNTSSFDLHKAPYCQFTFLNYKDEQYLSALRAIRLTEMAGLPSSTGIWSPALEILASASERLSPNKPELAARLALRITRNETGSRFNLIFSRTRIASLSADSVIVLTQDCINGIEFAITRLTNEDGTWNGFWLDRMRVLLEALSRFVVRLEPKVAEDIFNKAIKWYEIEKVASRISFAKLIQNILERTWEALPMTNRCACVSKILYAPIVGVGDFLGISLNILILVIC